MAENYSFVDPKTGAIWQKVLFHRPRTFPDNFTPDECFLAAIKRNQNLHKYTLQQCFLGATQVSFIVIFKMSSYFLVYILQCWTVGAIFTFGRSRMFGPDKLRQIRPSVTVVVAVGLKSSATAVELRPSVQH